MKPFLLQIGCDRSKNLVDICGEKNFQALVCDALSVPIRSGSCDACISIAVIHHFSTAVSHPPRAPPSCCLAVQSCMDYKRPAGLGS